MDGKRKRCGNFSAFERWRLVEILRKYSTAVENKKHDACSNERKQRSWVEITNAFNNSERVARRTVKQLQKLWHDLKIRAKKDEKLLEEKRVNGITCFIDPLIRMVIDIISNRTDEIEHSLSESGYLSESTEKIGESSSFIRGLQSHGIIGDYAQSVFRCSIDKCFDSFISPEKKPDVNEDVGVNESIEGYRKRQSLDVSNADSAWQCTCGAGVNRVSVNDYISLCEHRAKCDFIRQNMIIQLEEHEMRKKESSLRMELLRQQLYDIKSKRDHTHVPSL